MPNKLIYSLFIFLLSSCSTQKKLIATTQENTRVETKYEVVYRTDTMYIDIPSQTAEVSKRDSTSKLENDYATSEARINPDGSLFHNLKTKPQKKPIPVQIPIERKGARHIPK